MIAQPIPRRSGREAFGALIEYGAAPDKLDWMLLNRVHSLDSAPGEMGGVAFHAPQCRKPAFQVALSHAYGDRLTAERRQRIVRRFAQLTGMHDRQYVALAHRDTLHVHEHFVGNLVHPETFQALDYGRLYIDLPRLTRQLEREFGLTSGAVPFGYFTDEERASRLQSSPARRPPRMKRWARFAIGPDIEALFRDLVLTWDDLHGALATRYGVVYEPTMNGGVLRDAFDTSRRVKASHVHPLLARNRLETRLGPYAAPSMPLDFTYTASYSAALATHIGAEPPRDLLRRFARDAVQYASDAPVRTREDWRSDTAERQTSRYDLLERWAKDDDRLTAIADPSARDIARRALQVVTLARYHELELRILRENAAARRIAKPRLRWSAWLLDQVRDGDELAIEYVRKFAPNAPQLRLDEPAFSPRQSVEIH